MFHTISGRMYAERDVDQRRIGVPLHNVDNNDERPQDPAESFSVDHEAGASGPGAHWGERDIGGPVDFRAAMQEYEEMCRDLSQISRARSHQTARSTRAQSTLRRVLTGQSRHTDRRTISEADTEAEAEEETEEEEKGFELGDFLRDGHFEKRRDGQSAKKVGVVFKNLTVQGAGATATFVKTLPSAIISTFGPDLYKILSRFIPKLPNLGASEEIRTLIHDFTGVVRNGEMLLVLGKPGSGCSTFLKAVADKRDGYASATGDVHYGGINAAEQRKHYRGEVNYNEEDDQHFPSLTVGQTLEFSLLNKTRKHAKGEIPVIISALLNMFGISHTRHTLVGDGKHIALVTIFRFC
jgi:ATP-binding cassette, subfamily G (WHITE), member 2, SNQ2